MNETKIKYEKVFSKVFIHNDIEDELTDELFFFIAICCRRVQILNNLMRLNSTALCK